MNKTIKDWVIVTVALAWIPLGIIAFFLSPMPAYEKLLIAAACSFMALVVWASVWDGKS